MRRIVFILTWLFCMTWLTSCMTVNVKEVTDVRTVEGYTSIDINAVASVCFTQDDEYSFKMKGSEVSVGATTTEVKDGTLIITQKNTGRKAKNGKLTIYISSPKLENVSFNGVGSFLCKGRLDGDDVCFTVNAVGSLTVDDLHCRNLRLDFDGVGSVDMNVDCEFLEADVDGVGSMTFAGSAGNTKISKNGVGSCNVRNLKVGNK